MCNEDGDEEPTNVSFAPRLGYIPSSLQRIKSMCFRLRMEAGSVICAVKSLEEKCKVLQQ